MPRGCATVGIGAGQMSRVDAARIAARKAEDAAKELKLPAPLTKGSVVASDAFFPFADGLLVAIEAGATAVIQPGGSVRDDEVIKAADDAQRRDGVHRRAAFQALRLLIPPLARGMSKKAHSPRQIPQQARRHRQLRQRQPGAGDLVDGRADALDFRLARLDPFLHRAGAGNAPLPTMAAVSRRSASPIESSARSSARRSK